MTAPHAGLSPAGLRRAARELARRDGIPGHRFGLREEGSTVHIYFIPFRDAARIGTTSITFN